MMRTVEAFWFAACAFFYSRDRRGPFRSPQWIRGWLRWLELRTFACRPQLVASSVSSLSILPSLFGGELLSITMLYESCNNCNAILNDSMYYACESFGDDDGNGATLCQACQNYGSCDICRRSICVFCVKLSMFDCCCLTFCGAGCDGVQLYRRQHEDHEHEIKDDSDECCTRKHVVSVLCCGHKHYGRNFYHGGCRKYEEIQNEYKERQAKENDILLIQ
jgi:hypothetical protein